MNDAISSIMTIGTVAVLVIMLILLTILCVLYIKSRKNEKKQNMVDMVVPKGEKTSTKSYTAESVFDFMEFDRIEDNMICAKNGGKYIMVVECQGVNYDLMADVEKVAVEEGFIQFLNTLRHPIQIYTQTRTIDLEGSIEKYKNKMQEIEQDLEKQKRKYDQMINSGRYTDEQINAAFYELTKATNLCEYGKDIIYNTERMSLNKNVLNQKYYIVIPYYPEELGDNNFDKQEIKSLAFSELYTRAQSIIRTLSVCEVNGKILNSNELVDLLYVAYNRDDAEIYGVDKAIKAGYDELYSTAPDVLDKKMKALDEQIEKEAFKKANDKVLEVKTEKEQELQNKQNNIEDLIDEMAKLIINENRGIVGEETSQKAIEKIDQDTKKRRGRPKKQDNIEEGGTKENEKEKKTRRRATKTA